MHNAEPTNPSLPGHRASALRQTPREEGKGGVGENHRQPGKEDTVRSNTDALPPIVADV